MSVEFVTQFGLLLRSRLILRPFLVFTLQPPPQKLLPEHAQTLERYAWESFDPHSQGECT